MGNMGTTGGKLIKAEEHLDSVEYVSIAKGVRVHQLEGNNFLGRLEDAGRLSFSGSRGRLWRRHSSNTTTTTTTTGRGSTATGCSSSARSSCYSDLSSGIWQQQQQQQQQYGSQRQKLRQQFFSTAPAATTGGGGPSRSLDHAGHAIGRQDGSVASLSQVADNQNGDVSCMDLTTLLVQGFDPAAYEERIAERRRAMFSRRAPQQQQQQQQQQQPQSGVAHPTPVQGSPS